MSARPIEAGAIGIWLDSTVDGELWRVAAVIDGHLVLQSFGALERLTVSPLSRFWCLLDAGVLEL